MSLFSLDATAIFAFVQPQLQPNNAFSTQKNTVLVLPKKNNEKNMNCPFFLISEL